MAEDLSTTAELPLGARVRHGVRRTHVRFLDGIRHPKNWLQLLRFGAVGASGYVVNLVVFTICVHPLTINYRLASVIAFLIAVVNNFWWNRHWTFAAKQAASVRPGGPVLRRVAGRVRLLVRGAGLARRRRRVRQGRRPGDRRPGCDAAVVHRAEALELQGLGRLAAIAALAAVAFAFVPTVACAATKSGQLTAEPSGFPSVATSAATSSALLTAAPAGTPVLVPSMTKPPAGYRLTGTYVQAVAARNATVIAELKKHPHLIPYVYTKGFGIWQVSWFTPPPHQKEMIQVYVNDATGQVTQAWTGFQVQWTMARGYPGAFGRRVNSLYVWLPLCLAFLLPFLPLRLPRAGDPDGAGGARSSPGSTARRSCTWIC